MIHNGVVVGYRRRFCELLAKTLLERGSSPAPKFKRGQIAPHTQEQVDAELLARLNKLAEIRKRKMRAEQLAWSERMAAAGWAP